MEKDLNIYIDHIYIYICEKNLDSKLYLEFIENLMKKY